MQFVCQDREKYLVAIVLILAEKYFFISYSFPCIVVFIIFSCSAIR